MHVIKIEWSFLLICLGSIHSSFLCPPVKYGSEHVIANQVPAKTDPNEFEISNAFPSNRTEEQGIAEF